MIEINLLPKEMRRRKIDLPDISLMPIVILIVVLHLTLSFSANMKGKSLSLLEKKWEGLQPNKQIAEELTGELTAMRTKIDVIDDLIQGRMNWSLKLSDLCDAMISGVWLNKLWLEERVIIERMETKNQEGGDRPNIITRERVVRTLHLNGSVIATGGQETAAIGKFIKSLKNNRSFFSDFTEIETSSIQRSRLKDLEVMDFELVCYFKE